MADVKKQPHYPGVQKGQSAFGVNDPAPNPQEAAQLEAGQESSFEAHPDAERLADGAKDIYPKRQNDKNPNVKAADELAQRELALKNKPKPAPRPGASSRPDPFKK